MRSKEEELKSFRKIRAATVKRRDAYKKAGDDKMAELAQKVIDNCDMKIWDLEK